MARIKGEQLYLFAGQGALLPVGASTDCSVSMSAETVEVSARGQGRWRRFRPGKKTWNINCGGFYFDQEGVPTSLVGGSRMVGEVVKVAISILPAELAAAGFDLTDIQPNKEMTLAGEAIVTSCEYSGSVGSLATYSISLQGSGSLDQIA